MQKEKLVLVACGTGIATSTVVCKKVEELLDKNHVKAKVIQCKIAEVGSYEDQATVLVTTTIPPREYKIPVVKALNYLTNMNTEKTDKEILDALK
ncbi:PTS sugar transporter subunit IIB [Pectinatus cerevisiiphilus]|uniref:PTS system IIB component (Gat family) n=1 Tax=Pectinatus cerevisiiphilus TaxID=86956 RepID=A0A4R3KE20_9FIRM|nr:PTS sugar transporter subunit IIB [Pectinatus cerevisiiphilus]TCS81313.1 PTS system IIB component (Gat family) [Pectinatus cerevisiiphilus]